MEPLNADGNKPGAARAHRSAHPGPGRSGRSRLLAVRLAGILGVGRPDGRRPGDRHAGSRSCRCAPAADASCLGTIIEREVPARESVYKARKQEKDEAKAECD